MPLTSRECSCISAVDSKKKYRARFSSGFRNDYECWLLFMTAGNMLTRRKKMEISLKGYVVILMTVWITIIGIAESQQGKDKFTFFSV